VSTLDTAWQAALAAEHQAVFGYGLLGVHVGGAEKQLAYTCYAAHGALRDSVSVALVAAGLTPVPPEADYPSLYPVPDAGAARRLAVRLEEDCAAAWRYLYLTTASVVPAGPTGLRGDAQTALTASAVRATRWRRLVTPAAATTPFPGV
jgi:hypothetical protein